MEIIKFSLVIALTCHLALSAQESPSETQQPAESTFNVDSDNNNLKKDSILEMSNKRRKMPFQINCEWLWYQRPKHLNIMFSKSGTPSESVHFPLLGFRARKDSSSSWSTSHVEISSFIRSPITENQTLTQSLLNLNNQDPLDFFGISMIYRVKNARIGIGFSGPKFKMNGIFYFDIFSKKDKMRRK